MMHIEFASEKETASYIEQMLTELGKLSAKAEMPVLTYLIEMAAAEASDTVGGCTPTHSVDRVSSLGDMMKLQDKKGS